MRQKYLMRHLHYSAPSMEPLSANTTCALTASAIQAHLKGLLLFDAVFIDENRVYEFFMPAGVCRDDGHMKSALDLERVDQLYLYELRTIREYQGITTPDWDVEGRARPAVDELAVISNQWDIQDKILDPVHRYFSICHDALNAQRVALYRKHGYNMVPCYEAYRHFSDEYPHGASVAYNATLNNLPLACFDNMIFEDALDQVLEIRSDPDAIRKLRDLRLWLEHGIRADSIGHATDVIAQKLDDYSWAIQKHGLKTMTGSFSQILDWQAAALGVVAGAGGAVLLGPLEGLISAGTMVASRVLLSVVEKRIEYRDVQRGSNREVAIIYEINKKLAK